MKKAKSSSVQVQAKKLPVKKLRVGKASVKGLQPKPFPIVGFGASAGGLEAFTLLLKYLNTDLGMAYVLIMHLSPTHKSALTEILQSKTKMRVQTVKDGMEVMANNVYVIPPNTFMSLVDGHLKLAPRQAENFAVDYFFTALASIYKNNAIGVVLSGTATDGTLGLKAIKAEGGITFAQDGTAKFSGMPHHANDSGYVDFLLPPKGIAAELGRLAKVPYTILPSDKIEEKQVQEISAHTEELRKILAIVRAKSGIDFFHHYKHASIYRRVMRRMVLNKLDKLEDYCSILKTRPREVDLLFDDFLINVTSFFRDPEFYKTLTNEVFPAILKQESLDFIRIWAAGCSTGEEAYSIAICLMEYMESKRLAKPIKIFATDLDIAAIENARMGIYTVSALSTVPKNYLKKYFTKVDGHYQVLKKVREFCVFSHHNLLKDPPFSRVDLISCQNVLIYLETGPQKKIMQTFHYALKPTGYLFLGKSETIGASDDLFEPLDKKVKIYSRKATVPPQLEFTTFKLDKTSPREMHQEQPMEADVEKVMGKLVLSRYVYPSVVVNKNLIITQFFGTTSQYLEPVTGKASFNIMKMIREDLIIDLGALLQQVKKTNTIAIKENIRVYNKRIPQDVTIEVVPKKTSGDIFFLVIFRESAVVPVLTNGNGSKSNGNNQKDKIIQKLEEELALSRTLIRTTSEEFETTYEELQANNEEILSSNEELQSVNEELETSKEELQSAVEELTTTNEELHKRNIELDNTQKDLKQVNEQLEQFAFISSHDLQEPLRKILTFSSLLADPDANLNDFGKKYSEKINASAFRMSSLLKDLLSFSVLINSERNFVKVDLNETLADVIKDFEPVIERSKAVINISKLPVVHAEPLQMNQLFHSLIDNALKFTNQSPVITITSRETTKEDFEEHPELGSTHYTVIIVRDNGIGFDNKYIDKIFSLFQRLDDKKDAGGTGLGLAICKKVVKNHGGFIYAKGEKGKGATFTIFLPADL